MTCLDRVDRWSAQVHRLDLHESGRWMRWRSWCCFLPFPLSLGAFGGFSLTRSLASCRLGGHRHPMIEYLGPLPMHWFAATKFKILLN